MRIRTLLALFPATELWSLRQIIETEVPLSPTFVRQIPPKRRLWTIGVYHTNPPQKCMRGEMRN